MKNTLRITAFLCSAALASCASFVEFDEIPQAQLQKEAVLPDLESMQLVCPVVEQGAVIAQKLSPINGKWGCGSPAPYAVSSLGGAYPVAFSSEATVNCVVSSQLSRFFSEQVQPLALRTFGQPVSEIHIAASYACRPRNNISGADLSEHGRANAIDISAFTLADGMRFTVKEDWYSARKRGKFLREVNRLACRYFTTVIGPGGDKYHQDHIHLDYGQHGKLGTWRVCQ